VLKTALLRLLGLFDRFTYRYPGIFAYLFDNQLFRESILKPYLTNRPAWFERYFSWKRPAKNSNHVLLLRTDAIGDYILFRNGIEALKQHPGYAGSELTLLGNSIWRALAEQLDGKYLHQQVSLNRKDFLHPLREKYRCEVLWEINKTQFREVIYPAMSREFWAGDWIVKHVPAMVKTGVSGDNHCMFDELKLEAGSRIYNRLIAPEPGVVFEFDRNREILGKILQGNPLAYKQHIDSSDLKKYVRKPFLVLFPGGTADYRRWPKERFAEVAKHFAAKNNWRIVIAGGPEIADEAAWIQQELEGLSVLNLAGKTTLEQLMLLFYNSTLIVSNETSSIHFAAGLGAKAVCICNGVLFGRFHPYNPQEYPILTIYPPSFQGLSYEELVERHGMDKGVDIRAIEVEQVIEEMEGFLFSNG
jgi:ADP-heptose:LPS heptosyltransferase